MIAEKLNDHPDSTALILGTQTTVSSNAHKKRLVQHDILENRIAQQNCHGLAGAIERDPDSPEVKSLVNQFMAEAAATLDSGTKHIFAALCCTHYGYCETLIRTALARYTGVEVDIINPNQAMSDYVIFDQNRDRYPSVDLDVKVVSRVQLPPKKIDSISTRIESLSAHTAQALRDYERFFRVKVKSIKCTPLTHFPCFCQSRSNFQLRIEGNQAAKQITNQTTCTVMSQRRIEGGRLTA